MAAEPTFTGDYNPVAGNLYSGVTPEYREKELTREEFVSRCYTPTSD
ncbi:hypothetical protein HYW74_03345 [Candidatus Pacearchaeota archaeon]|nr:hypothetical protein [Candidatus Pacearchaeota archaeon]